jgi:hypothetical protein
VKRCSATIAALLIAAIGFARPVQAQTRIAGQAPAADYSFGQHITFHLQVDGPNEIVKVNLFFSVQGQNDVTVVPMIPDVVEPASRLDIDFRFSLAERYIPPFSTLTYWWKVQDRNGLEWTSKEQLLYYADNRYHWQSQPQEHEDVTLEAYWVQGDLVFGQHALNIAVEALDRITQELKAPVPGVIRMFIYPSEQDLRSALSLAGYPWAGGQARPELGVILVGIPEAYASGEMERLIPHEMAHLLVYEATGRRAGLVPPWLNEGLATVYQGVPDPDLDALVEQAQRQGRLFPLEALCAPFPADEDAARLAYAQSASVVYYLREEYGSQVVRDLLAAYADGASCEAGVNRVLGKNLEGLQSAWLGQLTRRGQFAVVLQDSSVWLVLWFLTALLALPLVGMWSHNKRQR